MVYWESLSRAEAEETALRVVDPEVSVLAKVLLEPETLRGTVSLEDLKVED